MFCNTPATIFRSRVVLVQRFGFATVSNNLHFNVAVMTDYERVALGGWRCSFPARYEGLCCWTVYELDDLVVLDALFKCEPMERFEDRDGNVVASSLETGPTQWAVLSITRSRVVPLSCVDSGTS